MINGESFKATDVPLVISVSCGSVCSSSVHSASSLSKGFLVSTGFLIPSVPDSTEHAVNEAFKISSELKTSNIYFIYFVDALVWLLSAAVLGLQDIKYTELICNTLFICE